MRDGYSRSRARQSSYYSDSGDRGYAPRPRGGGNSLWKFLVAVVVIVVVAAAAIMFKDPLLGVFGLGGTPEPTPTPSVEATQAPEPTPEETATVEPTQTATAEPTATATPEPTAQPVVSITVSAVGNIILDTAELKQAKDSSGNYDFSSLFEPVKGQFANSSLVLGTLESTVAGKDAGYTAGTSKYNTPDSILSALQGIGFKVLSTAHEHIFDKGYDGMAATMDGIAGAGMTAVGTYKSKDDYHATPSLLNVNGVQVAVLAYSAAEKYQSSIAKDKMSYAIKHINLTTIKTDVEAAKAAGAQVVIVMLSWGKDADKTPSSAMQDQAKKIVGYGANLVIGSNPSYVQKIEKVSATVDGATVSGIVAYSLGNFISGSKTAGKDCGVILNVTFERDPNTNTVTIKDATYTPTYVYVDSKSKYSILPAHQYLDTPDLLDSLSSTAKKRVQKVWDEITALLGSNGDCKPVARSAQ